MNNSKILLQTVLDSTGFKKNIKKIQDLAKKYPIELETKVQKNAQKKENNTISPQGLGISEQIACAAMYSVSKFKNTISELNEINKVLTEICKTSDKTAASLKQLSDVSFERAGSFGIKASDHLTATHKIDGNQEDGSHRCSRAESNPIKTGRTDIGTFLNEKNLGKCI